MSMFNRRFSSHPSRVVKFGLLRVKMEMQTKTQIGKKIVRITLNKCFYLFNRVNKNSLFIHFNDLSKDKFYRFSATKSQHRTATGKKGKGQSCGQNCFTKPGTSSPYSMVRGRKSGSA